MPKKAIALSMIAALSLWCPALAQDLVSSQALSELGFYKYWQAQLPLKDAETLEAVHLVGENIYGATNRGYLYAIHADIDVLRWGAQLGGSGTRIFPPTHVRSFWGKDLVLITTSDGIQWRDRADGELVQRLEIDFVPSAAAVSDGVRIYACGLDSMLRCYELVPTPTGISAVLKWRVRMGQPSVSTPSLWRGGLFFGSEDGKIRACDSYDKTRFWVFRSGASIHGGIHVDSTGVYFATMDSHLYKLDVNTGKALWRYRTPGSMSAAPVLVGDILFQEVQGQGIYALNADTGALNWHDLAAGSFITASKQRVFFTVPGQGIAAADSRTGEIAERVLAPDAELVARNSVSSAMYLANRSGRVLCAQDQSVPYLRFEKIEAHFVEQSKGQAAAPAMDSHGTDRSRPALIDLLRSKDDASAPSNED